ACLELPQHLDNDIRPILDRNARHVEDQVIVVRVSYVPSEVALYELQSLALGLVDPGRGLPLRQSEATGHRSDTILHRGYQANPERRRGGQDVVGSTTHNHTPAD